MPYPYRYAPNAEVLGAAASSIFDHIQRDAVIDSLRAHGVDRLNPNEWYPVDKFINVFRDWYVQPGVSANLVSVGIAIITHAVLPAELDALSDEQKLFLIGQVHDAQHRFGDPGRYVIEQVGPQHIRYIENTVYPDDMIYGYVYGCARRWLPGKHFTVYYDENSPRQEQGGSSTIIHLTWTN